MTTELKWGTNGTPVLYPVSDEAKATLKEQNIEAPEVLTLYLKPCTGRERKKFEQHIKDCKTEDDQREFVADLLVKRTLDVDRAIIRETLEDANTDDLNGLMYAFINGVMPDPKELRRATRRVAAQITPKVLGDLEAS